MPVAIDLIKQFPLFEGIGADNLTLLAQNTQLGAAKQGQEILSRGSAVSFLTFVVSGKIQASEIADDNRVIGISILVPGDIIGCLTLVDSKPTTVSLRTLEDSQLLLVPMMLARQLMKTEPLVAERVLQLMANALRSANKERAMLSLPNAFHRIFVQLNILANNQTTQRQIRHIPRQQDIAAMVNTSRETVSRALNMLIKKGILTKSGHQLEIRHPETLNQLARDGLEALPQKQEAIE